MDLSPEIKMPLERVFKQFFKRLATDTEVLVSKPVKPSLREVKLLQGVEEIDPFFETDLAVVSIREDGKDLGDAHLFFDVRSAIAFSGLMMMMPTGSLSGMVQQRTFDEGLQEAFHEIGNIAVGSLNALVENKIKGGHLLMESAVYVDDMEKPEAIGAEVYLNVAASISVGDFDPETFHILVSPDLAEALAGVQFPVPEEETPDSAASSSQAPPGASSGEAGSDSPPNTPPGSGNPAALSTSFPEGSELAPLVVDPASAADENDTVSQAIALMKRDDARQIGILRNGALIRVISRSDLRQLMGLFYGTNGMSARDKAVLNLQLGKICTTQKLISVSVTGSTKEAVELVIEHRLKSLPVVDDKGKLHGFIPTQELLKLLRKFLH